MKVLSTFCVAVTPLFVLNGWYPTSASAAGVPIVDFEPSKVTSSALAPEPPEYYGFYESHANGLIGWTFTVKQPATITQVGVWDQGGDGLSRAFQIGLWQGQGSGYDVTYSQSGELLGADGITVPGGTATELNGIYRVVDLPQPLNLSPGDYELGMLDTASTTDPVEYVDGGPSNAQVTIGSPFIGSGETMLEPAQSFIAVQGCWKSAHALHRARALGRAVDRCPAARCHCRTAESAAAAEHANPRLNDPRRLTPPTH